MNSKKIIWFNSLFTKAFYTFIWYKMPVNATKYDKTTTIILLVLALLACFMSIVLNIKKIQEIPIVNKITGIFSRKEEENKEFDFFRIRLALGELSSVFGIFIYFNTGNSLLFFLCIALTILCWIINIPINRNK